ncbi:YcjF family protein [Cylindrospermopsis raciborskii]|uniref:YcjF family protein n=1 Tax=Cylindrospermopsis raciborskii TaxID=77022 RepID=UPI0008DE72C5|nr:DUF697 domain-containing protein [Cylindrospermopsis raciborskii]OHY33890.1 hypothetical protein BCV64_07890 [Cylindrospermopsis raciborskii MVCC14]
MNLQKPILVGGLGLSFSLWMLNTWHNSIIQVAELGMLGALAVGGGLWLLRKNQPGEQLQDSPLDRTKVEAVISQTQSIIHQIVNEVADHPNLSTLQEQLTKLTLELDRKEVQMAVTGGRSVGKSTIIHLLKTVSNLSANPLELVETSPLFTELGQDGDAAILLGIQNSDLVLFVTNGDLTASQLDVLQKLRSTQQLVLLVFNKQDQYMTEERIIILQSLQQTFSGHVLAISASSLPIKVRKHLADGSIQEEMEQPTPNIQQLVEQLMVILAQQTPQLVCATTWRKSLFLKTQARSCLNSIRRDRSLPIVEQNQWIAGAAAFANPLPALDILATVAITGQMVMDLGNIYQQKISLDQAQTVAGTLATLMFKLGLVELSTKAVTSVLKTNAVTFFAGGMVEGVSAAYLTKIAGLSLIEYFEQQDMTLTTDHQLNMETLGRVLQRVFRENQTLALLETFVKQGVKRLSCRQTKPILFC